MIKSKRKILILAQHFDDDVLSFGGLIIKSIRKGYEIKVHVFTAGGPCSNVNVETRVHEFETVMKFLGVTDYSYSGIGLDGRLDLVANCELTGMIDDMIENYEPDEVYCGPMSEHADHQSLVNAFTASARLKSGHMPKLFALGTYMFSDQLYSNPSGGKIFNPLTEDDFKIKCKAFSLYKSQQKHEPSPLGLAGLETHNRYLGLMCGSPYAELYYQLRYIRD